jgi:hypothetical protein
MIYMFSLNQIGFHVCSLGKWSLTPESTRRHLEGYGQNIYINKNGTQKQLEPRTYEDTSQNSIISLTGQNHINN